MNNKTLIRVASGVLFFALSPVLVTQWVGDAKARLSEQQQEKHQRSLLGSEASAPTVAIASAANEDYCTGDLKKILRRVLLSCGLLDNGEVRGCQPAQAKNVATMSGPDFNALFTPLAQRAGIVQFDLDSAKLTPQAASLLEQVFADQRGASYFFVVARASPEGSVQHNRELSQARAESVLQHLRQTFDDPDLDHEVGLLWLGEEFAQLDNQFCDWRRSGESCTPEELNRSAFGAWIDCRL